MILCDPTAYTVGGILQARTLECVAFPFFRGSSQPRSPPLQVDSLPAEPQGKPKNTEVGSLSLLQWIFSTQESNWGLLHCREILYQLNYQEPMFPATDPYFSGFFFAYTCLPEAFQKPHDFFSVQANLLIFGAPAKGLTYLDLQYMFL